MLKPYKYYFKEARREVKYAKQKGKDIPVRLSAYDELNQYKNDPNIYISFRSIDKIGINPMSNYNTANGIYTYPLKEIWEGFNHDYKMIKVPFAGEHPYIYVVKAKGRGIDDLYKYSSKDFDDDLKKLESKYKNIDMNTIVNQASKDARVKNPGGIMWYLTMLLAKELPGKTPNNWNIILSKVLGYNYVGDKTGQGIIHTSEPLQTVFFSTKGFTTVDKIVQDKHRKDIYNKGHWIKSAKTDIAEYKIDNNVLIWKYGIWIDGKWYGGVWVDGLWKNGTWIDGTWEDGDWKSGSWKNGTWRKGFWKSGTWEDGMWIDGEWLNGTWLNGVWMYGSWNKGTWKKGEIYDPERKGNPKFVIAQSKEDKDYVITNVSPKEYFGQEKSPYN